MHAFIHLTSVSCMHRGNMPTYIKVICMAAVVICKHGPIMKRGPIKFVQCIDFSIFFLQMTIWMPPFSHGM